MGKLTSLLKERPVKNIGFPPLFQVWLWLSLYTHDRLRVFRPIQQGQGCWVHNKRWYVWKDLVCHMINDTTLQVNNARLLILLSKTTRNIFLQVMWALYVDAGDRPLVVQFAASNAKDFADAAELVAPFADGVDLNCGCPQRYMGDRIACNWPCFFNTIRNWAWGQGQILELYIYIYKKRTFSLTHTHIGGQWLRAMVPIWSSIQSW